MCVPFFPLVLPSLLPALADVALFAQGTLAPIVKTPSMAVPTAATLEALERLSADPRNVVYIISGRDGEFLEQHLGHLTRVGFSAEHGGFVREPGAKDWTNFTEKLDMGWMPEVEEIFRYYTEVRLRSCPSVWGARLIWGYAAHDGEPYRAEEKLDYLALSGERPGVGVRVFFALQILWSLRMFPVSGSSSADNVRICWRITWRISGRLRVGSSVLAVTSADGRCL